MNLDEPNPFASPAGHDQSQDVYPTGDFGGLKLATSGQRFLNVFIDGIIYRIFSFAAGIALGAVYYSNGMEVEGPQAGLSTIDILGFFIGLAVFVAFYAVCESVSGKTPGKLVTGTRVVSEDGSTPTTGQILGRTLCRLIPFEAFSFLGKNAVGWHDQFSKTRVIQN